MADSQLSGPQEKALVALCAAPTVAKAATDAGCSVRTLYRWLSEPAFADAYRAARRANVQRATARLQYGADAAASVLLSIMADSTTPKILRLKAASTILEYAFRGIELDDLVARVAALEAAAADKGLAQ